MTTLNFSAGSADLWGDSSGGLHDGTNQLRLGDGSSSGAPDRAWIPFAVTFPRATIVTATLTLVGSATRTETIALKVGCEAADNASAPADWTALAAKTLTTSYTSTGIATNVTAGDSYAIDVTAAVQEVLNRAGWAYGNTLAILIVDDGTGGGDFHDFATVENPTHGEATLSITYTTKPRGNSGVF